MTKNLSLLALLLVSFSLVAQEDKKEEKKWDVADPGSDFNYQNHQFTTDEGTWMNLDVSPDGKTLIFDLLGDIYSVPITGGKAKPLRNGIPFEIQPRFSPDGKKIAFTGDAGAGKIWQYHRPGGSGAQLTKRKNDQQDVNEPCISPDGKYLYSSEHMYTGGFLQYNKDPNKQIYVIRRYEFETGKTTNITRPSHGMRTLRVLPDRHVAVIWGTTKNNRLIQQIK